MIKTKILTLSLITLISINQKQNTEDILDSLISGLKDKSEFVIENIEFQNQTIISGKWDCQTKYAVIIFNDFKGDFVDYGGGNWMLVGTAKKIRNKEPSSARVNWYIEYDKTKDILSWKVGGLTKDFKTPYNSDLISIKTDIAGNPTAILIKKYIKGFLFNGSYITFKKPE